METYLVIDIGGSAIKYAHMSKSGDILEKGDIPVPYTSLEDLIISIQSLHQLFPKVVGLAVSMPGIIDMEKGIAYTGGALSYIVDCPFVELLENALGIPVTIGNDAKCAGFAEVACGSLQDVEDAVVIILGTGIGGCVIKDKKVHQGRNFAAGEISSLRVNNKEFHNSNYFWCYRNGTRGLLHCVQERLECEDVYNGKEIFEMANQGNELVKQGIRDFCLDIAIQIFNMQAFYDPQKIAIGGGISWQPLLMELLGECLDTVFKEGPAHPIQYPNVVVCQYRNDANLIGAFYQHLEAKRT
ncbi:ROK family protein [Tannockella kyphosi]|uniref:ROK family protein n=1 Tax=Tannockella kyphosi TaxID=2899121 RepID=UPI002012C7C3|nr:ROK family protein [Tannockella kyphosi]